MGTIATYFATKTRAGRTMRSCAFWSISESGTTAFFFRNSRTFPFKQTHNRPGRLHASLPDNTISIRVVEDQVTFWRNEDLLVLFVVRVLARTLQIAELLQVVSRRNLSKQNRQMLTHKVRHVTNEPYQPWSEPLRHNCRDYFKMLDLIRSLPLGTCSDGFSFGMTQLQTAHSRCSSGILVQCTYNKTSNSFYQ